MMPTWLAARITPPVAGTRPAWWTRTSYRRRTSQAPSRSHPAQQPGLRVSVAARGEVGSGHGTPRTGLGELDDPGDHLVEGEVGAVDVDGSLGHGQGCGRATGVDPVTLQEGLLRARHVGAALLGRTTLGSRVGVGAEVDLDLGLRPHDRADVAPLDDDAAGADDLALQLEQAGADLRHGADRADRGGDVLGPDLDGDVVAVDGDRGRERVGAGLDDGRGGERRDGVGVSHVDALAQQPPRHRAEHRAGVEVAQAQPLGDPARGARLAGARRAVDGNDDWVSASTVLTGREDYR